MNRFHFTSLLALTVGVVVMFNGCTNSETANAPKAEPKHLVAVSEVLRSQSEISRVRTGTLRARHEVKIFNQEEGPVTELPYYEGDRVGKGDVVFRLDDTLLRSQLDKARALLNQAEQEQKRTEKLHERKLISDEDLVRSTTNLEVARSEVALLETRLGYMTGHAPITGIVTERLAEPGNVLPRHTHLMTLIDAGSLVTEVSVSDLLLPLISVGDPVVVRIDALGEKVFSGSVSRIHPTLDASTRRGTIEVVVTPVPRGARPGQLCRVELTTHAASRLLIPFSALRRDEEGEFVFTLDDSDAVRRAAVRSGLHVGEQVEILEGLSEGQRVITKGFLGLSEGKVVKPVTSG